MSKNRIINGIYSLFGYKSDGNNDNLKHLAGITYDLPKEEISGYLGKVPGGISNIANKSLLVVDGIQTFQQDQQNNISFEKTSGKFATKSLKFGVDSTSDAMIGQMALMLLTGQALSPIALVPTLVFAGVSLDVWLITRDVMVAYDILKITNGDPKVLDEVLWPGYHFLEYSVEFQKSKLEQEHMNVELTNKVAKKAMEMFMQGEMLKVQSEQLKAEATQATTKKAIEVLDKVGQQKFEYDDHMGQQKIQAGNTIAAIVKAVFIQVGKSNITLAEQKSQVAENNIEGLRKIYDRSGEFIDHFVKDLVADGISGLKKCKKGLNDFFASGNLPPNFNPYFNYLLPPIKEYTDNTFYYEDIVDMSYWEAMQDEDFINIKFKLGQAVSPLKPFDITESSMSDLNLSSSNELRGFVILLKLQSENESLGFKEKRMYSKYYSDYIRYSRKHLEFYSRKCEMTNIINEIRQHDFNRCSY